MLRKYFLSTMIFICSFYLSLIPLSAQEDGKITDSNRIGKEIQAEKLQFRNLSKLQTVSSDSGEIEAHQDTTYEEPGTAFYLELGGKVFGSINVDFPIRKSNRITFGLLGIFPSFMYFYLPGDKNSRLEIGCGFSYIWVGPGGSGKSEAPLICHGVIGYRYQKKKGLLFRAGFTPMLSKGEFVPWIGISLGYSL